MTLPNQLTILRIILTPIIIYTLTVESLTYRYLALLLFFIASLTDWYDGYIARKFGSVSDWGKFLDPLADKILVLSMFIAFWLIGQIQFWMVVVIAMRDIIITVLRVYAIQQKKPIVTSTFAKWKTASQMIAIYLILLFLIFKEKAVMQTEAPGWVSKLDSLAIAEKIMYVVTFITATSGLQYMLENRSHLKGFACALGRMFLPTNF